VVLASEIRPSQPGKVSMTRSFEKMKEVPLQAGSLPASDARSYARRSPTRGSDRLGEAFRSSLSPCSEDLATVSKRYSGFSSARRERHSLTFLAHSLARGLSRAILTPGQRPFLILSVIRRDGQVIDSQIRLDSFSGDLSQPQGPEDHGFEPRLAPMFSEQMFAGARGGDIGAWFR